MSLTPEQCKQIVDKITANEGVLMKTQSSGRELWCITVNGKAMRCVYCPRDRVLVTIMERPGKYRRKNRNE